MRLWITSAALAGAAILLNAGTHTTSVPARQPLRNLPLSLGEWRGEEMPLTDRILAAAGVDDYVNRVYSDGSGTEVELYIGYYTNQRSGDLIHSPKNCLPAAGWESVRQGALVVPVGSNASILVNDFRIAKGLNQDLVLYWYQGRGRVVADEYKAKFWTIFDAAVRHRTDGSLVRLAIPIRDSEASARERGIHFVRALYPQLAAYIPY
jgi:EpsI family protein